MPSGATWEILAPSPSNWKECMQYRQVKVRRVQFSKRTESGIWLSNGEISAVCLFEGEDEMLYFRVSRPRHSARCIASVPGMGAQRRSTGGNICLYRYHSMSGFKVEEADVTSAGAYALLAADSFGVVVVEDEVVVVI